MEKEVKGIKGDWQKLEHPKFQNGWAFSYSGILVIILIILWINYENKSSSFEDYKMCVSDCVMDNEGCVSDYSFDLSYVSDCNTKSCVQDFFDDFDIESTTCSDDLSFCIDDCEI